MRLTLALLFEKLPNGNIFRGKHKLNPKIRNWMKRETLADIQREEANMQILRHHYLTKQEVKGYRYDMGLEREFVRSKIELRRKNFPANIYLEDRMGRLRIKDSWEKYFD
ncbi:uncharacterized protein LOC117649441 [Thrips palmi]|uniref:Uncharacterized protein LOC117649441 n=1 Tax=Thrips palmi TaxID=161013 RepID=A0A6P8ZSW9_THRPL|nr:uncharacterized protein LOC117649441 [Thrips palmi]